MCFVRLDRHWLGGKLEKFWGEVDAGDRTDVAVARGVAEELE